MKTAEQAAARWKQNAGAAQQTWVDGIQGTTVDVMGRAIAAAPVAAQRFAAVVADGTYARRVQASGGTANWKSKTEAKAGNYSTGINAGADKQAVAIGKILNALGPIVQSLPARVPGNPQANLARVSGVVMGLHAKRGQLGA